MGKGERGPVRSADDPSNETATLLTLPVTDFPGSDRTDRQDRFVLLQLPPTKKGGGPASLSVSDLMSGAARIIGPSGDDESGGGGDDRGARQNQQACLVLEDRGVSFALNLLETSNALVLVPPAPAPPSNGPSSSPPAIKKPKLDGGAAPPGAAPFKMCARLLQPGGSGASFLEARPHRLDRPLLRRKLAECEYDPYAGRSGDTGRRGHSVDELALILRCSEREVLAALRSLVAFEMPNPTPGGASGSGRFGTLSEEAQMDATVAIVEALNECEEYSDLFSSRTGASSNVEEKKFVERVVGRSREGGAEVLEESAVRHCLRRCAAAGKSEEEAGCTSSTYPIDLKKIAIFLGHHLFSRQSEPWEEQSFLAEWHKFIPGVGEASRPDVGILIRAGMALRTSKPVAPNAGEGGDEEESNRGYLAYFPEGRLPMEPEARFRKIFQTKEQWLRKDLEPFVANVAEEHGSTVAEMIMKHTGKFTDEEGKQWYVAL